MKYDNIKLLIDYYERFERETGAQKLQTFSNWLHQQLHPSGNAITAAENATLNGEITQYLGMLFNHTRHYIKTATKETPLVGWNDLIAIVVLYYGGNMRKTELIQRCLLELSPGIEVIKRLLRLGLIFEAEDAEDGRAKQIALTETGRLMYQEIEKRMEIVGSIVAGNLNIEEKRQLSSLLEKLVTFHQPIYDEDLGSDLQQIAAKWIDNGDF